MSNFDPAKLDWTVGLLAGWTYDKEVNKWFQGQFRRAHRLTRPCPTCSETIVLDVTAKALEGKVTNHGLALRRCKKCRAALKAGPQAYAERKASAGVGSHGGMSRPTTVEGVQAAILSAHTKNAAQAETPTAPAVPAEIMQELETLRTANATMKEELDGLYMQNKELRQRLASYEPAEQPAPAAPKPMQEYRLPPEPLTMAQSVKNMQAALAAQRSAKVAKTDFPRNEEMLKEWLAKNNAKMPWEGG